MKKVLAIVFASLLALSVVGCSGGSGSSSSSAQASGPDELVVSDSNYIIADGYVHYAVEIQNPNDDYVADFATITVTSKTEDGSISFSDEWMVSEILPGSTTYWASQAGDGDTVEADIITISVSVNDSDWEKSDKKLPEDLYTFENVKVAPDQFGDLSAKGEITLTQEEELDIDDVESPMIVCILKDAEGKIITGFSGYMSSDLKVDTPAVFDIDTYFGAPAYTTAEMHANPW